MKIKTRVEEVTEQQYENEKSITLLALKIISNSPRSDGAAANISLLNKLVNLTIMCSMQQHEYNNEQGTLTTLHRTPELVGAEEFQVSR
ncbi:hypothetical protein ANN_21407 [Periplaneta americana]|uniref:Uncharacterized protein n=1 Tax=Periplaneta americana TaxID=6978 RepID=A0ABQ8SFJ4_PERAM|nr:hypothetical protein ANN_21407 [Periplaneta americana]